MAILFDLSERITIAAMGVFMTLYQFIFDCCPLAFVCNNLVTNILISPTWRSYVAHNGRVTPPPKLYERSLA